MAVQHCAVKYFAGSAVWHKETFKELIHAYSVNSCNMIKHGVRFALCVLFLRPMIYSSITPMLGTFDILQYHVCQPWILSCL